MSESSNPQEKKIIIDEDWKSQVEAEKAQAGKSPQGAAPAEDAQAATGAADGEQAFPPASFMNLLVMLGSEAMMAMGKVPSPFSEEPYIDRGHARYAIDLLEILQEKTKGNLTPEEDEAFVDLLHQLRMAFITI